MTTPDQLIDMLVGVLISDPTFQDKVRELAASCIADAHEIVEKVEDVVTSSGRVEAFIKEAATTERFEGRAFRNAVQDVVKDMEFSVEVN